VTENYGTKVTMSIVQLPLRQSTSETEV